MSASKTPAKGTGEPAERVRLSFDGRQIEGPAGCSVAAALMDNDIVSWRTTRGAERPRGLYCGIGVCWDCLVSVDGKPVERACMLPARDGMAVSSADPALAAQAPASATADETTGGLA